MLYSHSKITILIYTYIYIGLYISKTIKFCEPLTF